MSEHLTSMPDALFANSLKVPDTENLCVAVCANSSLKRVDEVRVAQIQLHEPPSIKKPHAHIRNHPYVKKFSSR